MTQPDAVRRYQAFISYSHTADERLAPALQNALHRFATRPWRRTVRVSLDRTNLSISPGLWSSVQQQLDDAAYLILLASPSAATSKWVRREVEHWLIHRSPETLLIVLTDGEIGYDEAHGDFDWSRTTALPPELAGKYSEEPHYLDLRWTQSERDLTLRHERFRDAVADISVKLRGGRKDELIGREVEQQRFVRRLIGGVGIVVAILVLVAGLFAWNMVESDRLATSRELAANATRYANSDLETAMQLAIEAVRTSPTTEAVSALRQTLVSASVRLPWERASAMPAGAIAIQFSGEMRSRDGRFLVRSLDERQTVEVIDTASNARLTTFDMHMDTVMGLDISPDGTRVASVGNDGVGYVWNARNGAVAFPMHTESDTGYARVVWSPDGEFVVAGGNDGSVQAWDAASGEKLWASMSGKAVTLIAVSPDSQLVATASEQAPYGDQDQITALVWNVQQSGASHCVSQNCMFGSTALELEGIGFSADSQYLVTSGPEGEIVWRALDGVAVLTSLEDGPIFDAALERAVVVIDAGPVDDTGRKRRSVDNVGFEPGGTLVTVDRDGGLRRWIPPLWTLDEQSEAASANAITPPPLPPDDGRVPSPDRMLTVQLGGDQSFGGEVVETSTNEVVANVRSATQPVSAAAFSPDGAWLAVADGTRTVRLHRWETIVPLARLRELAEKTVGPLDSGQRARLIPPTPWQRLARWAAALAGR
jgi:WD40 repeat protein